MSTPSKSRTSTASRDTQRVMVRSRALARELGVHAATIDYWEHKGHIPPAERDQYGVRVWDRSAVHAAVMAGWRGLRAGGHGGPSGSRPRSERARERDRLDDVIKRVAFRAADKAVKQWLTGLRVRGELASGSVAGPEREKKRQP